MKHLLHIALQIQSVCNLNGVQHTDIIVNDFSETMDSQLVDVSVLINAFLGDQGFHQTINIEQFLNEFTANAMAWTDSDNVEHRIISEDSQLLDEQFIDALALVLTKIEIPIISFNQTLDTFFSACLDLDLPKIISQPNFDMEKLEKYNFPLAHIVKTFKSWIENGHQSISTDMMESLNESYFPRSLTH